MRARNKTLATWLVLVVAATGCTSESRVAKTTDSGSRRSETLQNGWQEVVAIPAVLNENDVVVQNSATLKLWVEDQWLIVRRTSAANELEWQVVLASANAAETPSMETSDGRCEVTFGQYFIRESLGAMRVWRQRKTNRDHWPSLAMEAGRELGSAVMRPHGVELTGQQVGEWAWVSSGLSDRRSDLWMRLEHKDLKGKGYGSRGGPIPAHFFYGSRTAEDDGELFVANRSLDEVVANERNKQKVRATLGEGLAPELSFSESHNTSSELTLSRLRGKPVLLDFWGMWCRPCVANLPKVEALHQEYRDQGFAVIGIHSSNGSENLSEFLSENRITFPVVVDQGDTVKAYAVDQFPSYFLINEAGKVVKGFDSHPPTMSEVERLLEKSHREKEGLAETVAMKSQ